MPNQTYQCFIKNILRILINWYKILIKCYEIAVKSYQMVTVLWIPVYCQRAAPCVLPKARLLCIAKGQAPVYCPCVCPYRVPKGSNL